MKPILTEKLNLNQINSRFGLLPEDDILNYLERYDNGVEIMDDNYKCLINRNAEEISIILVFSKKSIISFKNRRLIPVTEIYN